MVGFARFWRNQKIKKLEQHQQHLNRRHFFGRSATGIGTAALASLLQRDGFAADGQSQASQQTRIGGLPSLPHFAPKAKSVIFLFMYGGPSHIDDDEVSLLDHLLEVDIFWSGGRAATYIDE